MGLLETYLLLGLGLHKLVWERLKAKHPRPAAPPASLFRSAAKAAKLLLLLALVLQPFLPNFAPLFSSPGPWRPLGLVLYTLGLAVAIHARAELGPWWADIEAGGLRPNHQLVGAGVYRWIRHPIYTGDLLLLAGYELALNSWAIAGVAALVPFVTARARSEEKALAKNVAGYALYKRRTKAFLPYLF
jgi:protein-S-isoprenylcysteine O-methyltransferase Ste14